MVKKVGFLYATCLLGFMTSPSTSCFLGQDSHQIQGIMLGRQTEVKFCVKSYIESWALQPTPL